MGLDEGLEFFLEGWGYGRLLPPTLTSREGGRQRTRSDLVKRARGPRKISIEPV